MPLPSMKGLALAGLVSFLAGCGGSEDSSTDSNKDVVAQGSISDSVISLRNIDSASCPSGAVEVQLGIDANANGRLDPDEIDHSRTISVCHGADGQNGSDGANSSIRITDASTESCEYGGKQVAIGIDQNKNNVLDDEEITQQESICNQNAPTYSSLVKTVEEPKGENCASGGVKVLTGLDLDANSELDNSEVQHTQYVCHGADAPDLSGLLFESMEEPWGSNCFHGGYKHQIGLDSDQDGVLSAEEAISTSYSCNPNEAPEITFSEGATAITGQPYSVVVKATDSDAASLNIESKPDWLSIAHIAPDHFVLSGIVPSNAEAPYEIEVAATDTDKQSRKAFSFHSKNGILISANAESLPEGNAGTLNTKFDVTLSKASLYPIEVAYSFSKSQAEFTKDWNALSHEGTLVFAPGETSKQVDVQILGDTEVELEEFIRLDITSVFSDSEELVIKGPASYLNILNDDGNQVVFGTEEDNRLVLVSTYQKQCCDPWATHSAELKIKGESPDWMTLVATYDYDYMSPYLPKLGIALVGKPPANLLGESGEITLVLKSDKGTSNHTLTYLIQDGDTDVDGSPNSIDKFPTNPLGQTDSDSDGLGDEWELSLFDSLIIANASSDFDSNGVSDLQAFRNNTSVHDLTFNFENGRLPNGWVNTGDVNWVVTDEKSANGKYAIKPETQLKPGQTARLTFSVHAQTGGFMISSNGYETNAQTTGSLVLYGAGSISTLNIHGDYWVGNHRSIQAGHHNFVLEYSNTSSSVDANIVYVDEIVGMKGIVPADRDGDGVLNNKDLFPDNALAAKDIDEDGIGDEWELQYFDNLTVLNPNGDHDNDGLSDKAEFEAGTNPAHDDSDFDGVKDGQDLYPKNRLYANDSDGDGLPDEWELQHFLLLTDSDGTQDSDGDGVTDAEEYLQKTMPALDGDNDGVSDARDQFPNSALYALDRDQDSLPDEWELRFCQATTGNSEWWCQKYPEEVIQHLSADGDFDGDSRTDGREFLEGTNPVQKDLTAVQDILAVSEGQQVIFAPTSNDISVNGDIAVTSISAPNAGQLVDNEDGTFTFTAPNVYVGWIVLNYEATDNKSTDTGRVFIRISDQQFGRLTKIKGNEGSSWSDNSYSMALFDDGLLYSWGANGSGQLGLGDTDSRYSPVNISGISDVKDFDLGAYFSAALKEDGSVWIWGRNLKHPTPVEGLANIKAIAASYSTLYVLDNTGTVKQLYASGVDFPPQAESFSVVDGLANIKAISAGSGHLLALDENGLVWGYGSDGSGQLGDGPAGVDGVTQVSKIRNIESIEAGGNQSFAIDDQGKLYAWGANYNRQLGDGTTTSRNVPVEVSSLSNVEQVAAGNEHTLIKTVDGSVYGAGSIQGFYSQKPKLITNHKVDTMGAGAGTSFILSHQGDTYSMGINNAGQLGNGSTSSTSEFGKVDWLNAGYEGLTSQEWGEGFEWGSLPPFWSNSGDAWLVTEEAVGSNFSVKVNESLDDNASATLGLFITTAEGSAQFKIKTSTEEGYDELVFYIDGVVQDRFGGEKGWIVTDSYPITAGAHSFEWVYTKDGGTSFGKDTVWIDDIVLPIDTDGDGIADVDDDEPNNPNLQ